MGMAEYDDVRLPPPPAPIAVPFLPLLRRNAFDASCFSISFSSSGLLRAWASVVR